MGYSRLLQQISASSLFRPRRLRQQAVGFFVEISLSMSGYWKQQGAHFRFELEGMSGLVQPANPTSGLIVCNQETKLAEVFQLVDPRLQGDREFEVYMRGCDLQIRLPSTEALPIEISLTWRLHERASFRRELQSETSEMGPITPVELLFSMRTDLMDAKPVKTILTECFRADWTLPDKPAGRIEMQSQERQNDHYALFNWKDYAAIVLAHPSDLRWQSIQAQETKSVQCLMHLRADDLEKGVIRRLRFLFALVSKERAERLRALPSWFAASQLPLSV